MRGRPKLSWKLTTMLFAVGLVECIIIGHYVHLPRLSEPASVQQPTAHAVFGLPPKVISNPSQKQLSFTELFKDQNEMKQYLPKLLHDYFKQVALSEFLPAERVGLLDMDVEQIRQWTLLDDSIVLHVNPHTPSSDTDIKTIAIKKELLKDKLNPEFIADGKVHLTKSPDYEIVTQPQPGNVVSPAEKMLALTFDDGPDGNTHALLDTLTKYEATATFFVLGQKVGGGAGVLQRMVREGHEIGNHSWSHPDLRYVSPPELNRQIQETQTVIQNATGVTPKHMRPPYGATNSSVETVLHNHGLTQAMWNIDSNDWRDKDPELLYQRIMSSAGDGKVILLHDIHQTSVQAAIRAIPDLKAQGYQLVTMTQMEIYR